LNVFESNLIPLSLRSPSITIVFSFVVFFIIFVSIIIFVVAKEAQSAAAAAAAAAGILQIAHLV